MRSAMFKAVMVKTILRKSFRCRSKSPKYNNLTYAKYYSNALTQSFLSSRISASLLNIGNACLNPCLLYTSSCV